ncbi:MAG: hypothetical protein GY807_22540 [Gammaproteobacteria bacterium]|nr:hypothetical protein [Gammaproteobacteria bacterium]
MHPREKRKELEQDSTDLFSEDEFPEEPNSWHVDDFDDILDLTGTDFSE